MYTNNYIQIHINMYFTQLRNRQKKNLLNLCNIYLYVQHVLFVCNVTYLLTAYCALFSAAYSGYSYSFLLKLNSLNFIYIFL